MNDLLALIALGLILHLALKLIIIMKLSELNGALATANSQLDAIATNLANRPAGDPELPADAAATLGQVQTKLATLVTSTGNPS